MYNSYASLSTFMYNSATSNGGAMSLGSADHSVFISNTASNYGGAVFNSYVEKCNFSRNSAVNGGALGGNSYSAVDSLFEYNSATNGEQCLMVLHLLAHSSRILLKLEVLNMQVLR
ncbi:hypothetical protein [uncultured Methanobrevibacter sp.]|uniref:hypothetical protein n=1 Tax=uncultured Methanobrevibacter sp. TaxID=253161 RepID=UPI0025FBC21A|nr:hypothetical protein [uncultured Methanobrevibacter sp.]